MQTTNRLYYDNAYLTVFDAQVVAVREKDGACEIALDQSAFYPTSGGQPYDTGTLNDCRVTDVTVEENVVWHRIEGKISVGETVHGEIDWPRRFDHMQQHGADHVLAGACWELFGGVTIGLHLGEAESSIDMTLPGGRTHLSEAELERLETLVNARIQRDEPVRCWFPEEEELASLPLRKKPTVTEHVRIVAFGDYEMVACGGTHPSTAAQLGVVKVISCAPARGKMRLTFVAGMRAVKYLQQCALAAQKIAKEVSSDIPGAHAAYLREKEAAKENRQMLMQSLTDAAVEIALAAGKPLPDGGTVYARHLPFADRAALLHAAAALTKAGNAVALLTCPDKNGCAVIFLRSADRSEDMSALLRACGARGGGKPDMSQGSAADESILAAALTQLGA